jgi:hypothetical protein
VRPRRAPDRESSPGTVLADELHAWALAQLMAAMACRDPTPATRETRGPLLTNPRVFRVRLAPSGAANLSMTVPRHPDRPDSPFPFRHRRDLNPGWTARRLRYAVRELAAWALAREEQMVWAHQLRLRFRYNIDRERDASRYTAFAAAVSRAGVPTYLSCEHTDVGTAQAWCRWFDAEWPVPPEAGLALLTPPPDGRP